MRLFISSPLAGLQEIREEILKSEKTLGVSFSSMESFLSSPNLPQEECLEHLRASSHVILILGPQYGSVDPKTGRSFTEIEFDEAQRLGIKIFPFIKAATVGEWKPEDSDPSIREKHTQFFQKVSKSGGTICPFTSPQDLIQRINGSIEQFKERSLRPYLPLVDYKDYFYAYLNHGGSDQLFRHDYDFIGRKDQLAEIDNFINSDKRVLVIAGRGGIGKSKLIYETAKKYEGIQSEWNRFLFIKDNVDFNDEVLKRIPSGRSVLVLEDAHRYDQLLNILAIFRNRDLLDRLKLIVTTRPSGLDTVRMNLSLSVDQVHVNKFLNLSDLSLKETEELVRQFIKRDEGLVQYIKEISKDCPLAAVIGSRLIAEGKIDPAKIKNSEDFNRRVLDRFLDEYKKALLKEGYLDDLIKYLAALAPIRLGDSQFTQALAKVLGLKESKVITALGDLESRGLLVRRGKLVRIAPDLLSDHMLYKACISEQGISTKFASEVYEGFPDSYAANLLLNVSEIEWRAKADGKKINLLENVWGDIYQKFVEASNYHRTEILKQIERASTFQPQQALKLIDIAIKSPSNKKEASEILPYFPDWDHEYVLRDLPKILQRISYHIEHLPKCCQLLWELGRNDKRELNPNPEHAIRILQDIAGYHNPRQSVAFKEVIVEFLEKISGDSASHQYRCTVFDIIDQILKKEGEYTTSDHTAFTFHPYVLNIKALTPIRKRAIAILEKNFLQRTNLRITVRAFRSLHDALGYAHGSFGRLISKEEEAAWVPEQLEILRIIKNGILSNPDKALHVLVKRDLRWFTKYARHQEVKQAVEEINTLITNDYDYRLCKAVDGDIHDFWDDEKDYKAKQEKIKQELDAVVVEILDAEKTGEGIFSKIESVLVQLYVYTLNPRPENLLDRLVSKRPELSVVLYMEILRNLKSPLANFSAALLWPLKHLDFPKEEFDKLVKAGIQTNDTNIIVNILRAYAWGGFGQRYTQEDIENLHAIASINDPSAAPNLLWALSHLGQVNPAEAKKLFLNFKVDEDSKEQYCGCINNQHGIPMAEFSKDDLGSILNQLVPINVFKGQDYHIEELLVRIGGRFPELVVGFLLDRLFYSRKNPEKREYAPLPYSEFDHKLLNALKIDEADKYIRQIRELSVEGQRDSFWLPKLFQAISANYSDKSLEILLEWVALKDPDKLEGVSMLLRDAPESFIFDRSSFIGEILQAAAGISEDCLKSVRSNLFGIAMSGGWTRSNGQPSEKHLLLKKMGIETAKKFPEIHPANAFYQDVAKYADETIKEELERDEELEYE